MEYIGRVLQAVREARCLSREAVAGRLRYGCVRKGIQRLTIIEATGRVKSDLLVNLLEVLSLDLLAFEDMAEQLYLTGRMPPIPAAVVGA